MYTNALKCTLSVNALTCTPMRTWAHSCAFRPHCTHSAFWYIPDTTHSHAFSRILSAFTAKCIPVHLRTLDTFTHIHLHSPLPHSLAFAAHSLTFGTHSDRAHSDAFCCITPQFWRILNAFWVWFIRAAFRCILTHLLLVAMHSECTVMLQNAAIGACTRMQTSTNACRIHTVCDSKSSQV